MGAAYLMGGEGQKGRRSAILAADVAGYTRLIAQDTIAQIAAQQTSDEPLNPTLIEPRKLRTMTEHPKMPLEGLRILDISTIIIRTADPIPFLYFQF